MSGLLHFHDIFARLGKGPFRGRCRGMLARLLATMYLVSGGLPFSELSQITSNIKIGMRKSQVL